MALAPKTGNSTDPIPDKDVLHWGISPEEVIQRQIEDKFCQNIRNRILKEGPKAVYPYYMEGELLMRYIEDNKQMFGRDPRLPLAELFQHKLRYLGTDETVLSLQALMNMYLVIAENLRKAREKSATTYTKKATPIQPNQLVMLKVHIRKTLDPRYEGTYQVIQIKGNQVEIACNGMVIPTKWAHISHLKPLLRADEIIKHLKMMHLPAKPNLLLIPIRYQI